MNPIILPYIDCAALTRQATLDLLAQSTSPSPLLLIDNGSQEDGRMLAEEMRTLYPEQILTWHHQPPFPALSAVWNRALEFCWEAGADQALVVNNDVRLAPWTYELLREVRERTDAWFVTAVSVTPPQFEDYLSKGIDHARLALGEPTESRKDGIRPEGYSYGGPDFSCYLITRECHRFFQFDEGFIPAYHEDNDFHRRLQLAGFGEKIFGVNLPFLHYGSATVNRSEEVRRAWQPRFAKCQQYYREKWGGLPGSETFQYPLNDGATGGGLDPRVVYTGQGKPGHWATHTSTLFERSR